METLPFDDLAYNEAVTKKPVEDPCLPKGVLSEQEKIARICLYRSQNVGPVTYHNLLKRYKTAEKALEALPKLAARGGRRAPLTLYSPDKVHEELKAHERIGARLLVAGESAFPKALRDIHEAPPVLSVQGNLDYFKHPGVAIVGARNCSLTGKKMAHQLADKIAQAGYPIISGLARGIDGEAHRASLGAGTIAVIAGGIDKIYPTEHSEQVGLHECLAKP